MCKFKGCIKCVASPIFEIIQNSDQVEIVQIYIHYIPECPAGSWPETKENVCICKSLSEAEIYLKLLE